MYIATGELRERLRDGSFPNELARWFKVADSQSALEYFTGFKWQFLPLLVFFIVGILHIDEKSLSSTVLVIGIPLLALCYILVPLGKRAKRFKWFEMNLRELATAIESSDRNYRPISLMWHDEIKERARHCLNEWAKFVLKEERAGSNQAEDIRTTFREYFDLFKGYSLLDPEEEKGYQVFFARAQAALDQPTS